MTEAPLSADRLYAETCTQIRATDEISFKLMRLVPLVSGRRVDVLSERISLCGQIPLVGKTEAEKAIYSITILVWLIMPMALIGSQKLSGLVPVYVSVAVLIAILTGASVLGSVRVAGTAAQAGRT